jgi:hypothetical protein
VHVISRKDAIAAGLNRYFNGKSCSNGHIDERFVLSRQCVVCSRECRRDYVDRNPAERTRKRTPEQKKQHAAYMRAHNAANPEKVKDNNLRKTYGITLDDYREMLMAQNGRCAICKTDKPGPHPNFHVDHCHQTKKVRGLLCHNCNALLGHAKDKPSVLRCAAEYLEAK